MSTISCVNRGDLFLSRDANAFELGVLFVRLFDALNTITGGDEQVARAWLANPNTALRAAPVDLIQNVAGLVEVVRYLDSRSVRI